MRIILFDIFAVLVAAIIVSSAMQHCYDVTQCLFYSRFERGPSFRVREERRSESDHRTKVDVRHSRDRYPESSKGEEC